jgi:hypothetical protein
MDNGDDLSPLESTALFFIYTLGRGGDEKSFWALILCDCMLGIKENSAAARTKCLWV